MFRAFYLGCMSYGGGNALHQSCGQIGRAPIPTRMSFRIEFSTITGNAPPLRRKRPVGHGTPSEVAGDLLSYREKADLDAFQINFHGNRNLDQLLQSMECFMQDVAPIVSGERPI
jgi:hypothetical protein